MREIFRLSDGWVRLAIREAYNGECQYCGAGDAGHVDHIVARSKGGEDALSNYILACQSCNSRKGNGDIAPQFLALITAIASKKEASIRRRIIALHNGPAIHGYNIGLSKDFCIFVPVNKKYPTIEQFELLRFTMDLFGKIKDRFDAEATEAIQA